MIEPTQAQIEAAAKTMFEAEQLARRKATESDCRVLARLALTAAAAVGEEKEYSEYLEEQIAKVASQTKAATIERCAQVADDRGYGHIAAAIRALLLGLALVFVFSANISASTICLSKREARHLWPKEHLYWYSGDHCWSNRRGPPRGIKLDPVIEKIRAEARPEKNIEAPLRSDQPMQIIKDFCCWPKLTEFDLVWYRIVEAIKKASPFEPAKSGGSP